MFLHFSYFGFIHNLIFKFRFFEKSHLKVQFSFLFDYLKAFYTKSSFGFFDSQNSDFQLNSLISYFGRWNSRNDIF